MKALIKVTKALSDPNRVKIIKLLQQRAMFVSEIQPALGIAQPTVSKHLKVLEDAGLVTFHKKGTWVRYRLPNGASSPYAASILGNLNHWLNKAPAIVELQAKRLQNFLMEKTLSYESGAPERMIAVSDLGKGGISCRAEESTIWRVFHYYT